MTGVMPDQVVDLHELGDEPVGMDCLDAVDQRMIARLARRARAGGLALKGEGGLLAQLTRGWLSPRWKARTPTTSVTTPRLRRARRRELPQRPPDQDRADRSRFGRRPSRPRRHLEPGIVAKRQRRLSGVDELMISFV